MIATRWHPGISQAEGVGRIVHASVEQAAREDFGKFLKTISHQKRLARIWFDEAHLALTQANFRPVFNDIASLRLQAVPLVLTTATCPPHMEGMIGEPVNMSRPRVIRGPTERAEAEYRFVEVEDRSELVHAKVHIQERVKSYGPNDRFMVFCQTTASCEEAARFLGVEAYHSGIDEKTRDEVFSRWAERGNPRHASPGIASTSMLMQGTDVPHIRDVIFVYLPRDPFETIQGLGRGGRDGLHFLFIVYWSRGAWRPDDGSDSFGASLMPRVAADRRYCRRIWFSSYFDGENSAQTCVTLPGALCDICQVQATERAPSELVPFPTQIVGTARGQPRLAALPPPRLDNPRALEPSIPAFTPIGPPSAGTPPMVPVPRAATLADLQLPASTSAPKLPPGQPRPVRQPRTTDTLRYTPVHAAASAVASTARAHPAQSSRPLHQAAPAPPHLLTHPWPPAPPAPPTPADWQSGFARPLPGNPGAPAAGQQPPAQPSVGLGVRIDAARHNATVQYPHPRRPL